MDSKIASLSGIAITLLIAYKVINLCRYILQARQTGLPWVFTCTLETETVGYVLTPILRWKYQNYLLQDKGWPKWCRLMIKDWSFEDKRRAHDEYGETFLAVSPEGIICYTCDANLSADVVQRRNEFTKPRDKYKLLEIYGPNVTTTEADTYRFHLRIVAPPFADNTGANDLVWNETRTQTRRLAAAWLRERSSSTQLDINGMTLAVIAKAGFGRSLEWNESLGASANSIPEGYTVSFLDAMTTTMVNMIPVLLLPKWLLYFSPLHTAAIAHYEFERYVRGMIREEKDKIERGRSDGSGHVKGNLLASVLRASAEEASEDMKSKDDTRVRKRAFTEEEIMGNLFLYLLAGYETTANAILYGLICLTIYPGIQERVLMEIDVVRTAAESEGRNELTYAEDFPRLKYTYGFMYETLRLFLAPQQITKMVSVPTVVFPLDPETGAPTPVELPAQCRVVLNVPATHHTESYWPDPTNLDPERWLNAHIPPHSDQISIKKYRPGTFLAFSDGARTCLGRKFAQAEYVRFVVALLSEHSVRLREGQDADGVARKILQRCKGTLTLAPLDEIGLVLERRERGVGLGDRTADRKIQSPKNGS